ncbi:MAG: GDSL-type esterase/lipase family protein [Gemmatimonadota bacterium]
MTENSTSEPSRAGLPLWTRLLFWSILVLIVVVALEGVGQVYLRVFRGYAGGEFLQYEFDPYKNIHPSRNWVDTRGVLRHNAQGFRRDEPVTRRKPDGTYRVFLMGASTAYGTGSMFTHIETEFDVLDNSETIDAYLEDLLSESLDHDRVEVINAGIPSVWTHHHLIYLNQTILDYEPDLIIFIDGWNDHYETDRNHDQFATYAQTEQAQRIMGPATLSSLIRMNGWWLFRKSAFAHVAIRAMRNAKTILSGNSTPPPIDVERSLEDLEYVFERNALEMIERNALLLQHEGIPAVFVLQPVLILEREHYDRMPPPEQELFDFMVGWQEGAEEFYSRATPMIADRIEEVVESLGGHFVDLTDIYDAAEGTQVYTDYVHLTPYGNRIVAERLAETIRDLVSSDLAETP